ncbi:protein NKG7-like [Clytia hemisphaerica]|uniref:Uncharacterized protein n=1 Tax=Clytia hemisphaerica TaxID=252671 RepID=A0A7M5XDV4_9CNID|eukprot:TCONS_00065664-protein
MANVAAIRFFAFFCGLLGVIFLITALPTHHWYHARPYGSNETVVPESLHVKTIYGGIFEDCREMSDGSYSCHTTHGDGYVKTTKAFLALGIVGYAAITIYTLLTALTRKLCYKVLGSITVITAFFIMVGMATYTDQHPDKGDNMEYGWSFDLGWVSFVLTLVAGILAFFGDVEYEKV